MDEEASGKEYSVMEVSPNEEENRNEEENIDFELAHQGTLSYLKSADFIEIICCVFGGAIIAALTEVPGIPLNIRSIPYQALENSGDVVLNLSLDEEFTGETVSSGLAVVIACIIPVIIQFILSKTLGKRGDAQKTVCVYAVALGLTAFTTNILKSYIGYLRPVFYDLCEPNGDYSECTDSDSNDARKSFPSGHSSLSFCGLTLLTLYLLARFGVYSGSAVVRESPDGSILMEYKEPARIKKLYSVLALAPMAVAGFVAASRVVDNKHFPADVVGGAVLGTSIAWFVHGLWFVPCLAFHPRKQRVIPTLY